MRGDPRPEALFRKGQLIARVADEWPGRWGDPGRIARVREAGVRGARRDLLPGEVAMAAAPGHRGHTIYKSVCVCVSVFLHHF